MSFLTAEWRKLIMANYEIEPSILEPYLPAFTELDFFEGKTYISLVGFLFTDVKLLGLPIPFQHLWIGMVPDGERVRIEGKIRIPYGSFPVEIGFAPRRVDRELVVAVVRDGQVAAVFRDSDAVREAQLSARVRERHDPLAERAANPNELQDRVDLR